MTKKIYDRLIAFSALTADLPTYLGRKAIFSGNIPPDAPLPYVLIGANISDEADDNGTNYGRDIIRDVFVYASAGEVGGSVNALERMAENVRTALHNYDLGLSGWGFIAAQASGPSEAPTDQAINGRVVSVLYRFHQTTNVVS